MCLSLSLLPFPPESKGPAAEVVSELEGMSSTQRSCLPLSEAVFGVLVFWRAPLLVRFYVSVTQNTL